jgi:signal transduction histidine kinase
VEPSTPQESVLLETLERLLEVSGAELAVALAQASDLVADALHADKVDVFMYDPSRDSLVALGSSHQPLSATQKRHGLDVLPVANGGRVVHVFQTASTFVNGELDRDMEELRGIRELLKIRSKLGVPLRIGGELRGVLMLASQQPHFWGPQDVTFAESVARWIGIVAHRSELTQEIARNAVAQGRQAVAEELMTVLAHDLRNYLAPLDWRLRSLRMRAERDGRQADLRDIERTLAGITRLNGLIGDMLDVARIDRGLFWFRPEPLPLLSLLEETASALTTVEHPCLVEAAEEVTARADPARVRQCVENLIGNAIKHSPGGGKVRVALSRTKNTEGAWACIEVIDEGPGIPEHILPHIFERFVAGKRSSEGLGLGLFLAKRIAVLHGGELTVDSKPGEGSRFRLMLPMDLGPPGA